MSPRIMPSRTEMYRTQPVKVSSDSIGWLGENSVEMVHQTGLLSKQSEWMHSDFSRSNVELSQSWEDENSVVN